MITKFTDAQLAALRAQCAKINQIDPCSPTYAKLVAKLDELPPGPLKQIADGNIKFMSGLARNRVARAAR